jgi:hypothetical protein
LLQELAVENFLTVADQRAVHFDVETADQLAAPMVTQVHLVNPDVA